MLKNKWCYPVYPVYPRSGTLPQEINKCIILNFEVSLFILALLNSSRCTHRSNKPLVIMTIDLSDELSDNIVFYENDDVE